MRDVYEVVGYSRGVTKSGDKFTKVALLFDSPYKDYHGKDAMSVFIYSDIEVQVGMLVHIEYGVGRGGKAVVKNIIPAE